MLTILGIDPGLRRTGWGLIRQEGSRLTGLACGVILTNDSQPDAVRLGQIATELEALIAAHTPDEAAVENVSLEEAMGVIKECMKVLFYRDARSLDRYSIAVVTKDGVDLKVDEKLESQSWAFAERIKGYGTQVV